MRLDFSTIAAISTPPGTGGVGMIRISGPEAPEIAGRIFIRGKGGGALDLRGTPSHRVFFGQIRDPASGALIDEVLLTWMAAPHTYTTEDTVEISCHGGQLPLQETLRVILAEGARHAEPGEFTLRAFLNGRLDLSQAEAVINVVGARTAEGLQLAVEDLRGDLTRRIAPARDAIVALLAYLDAAADFPDDEIPGTDVDAGLKTALAAIDAIVEGSRAGMLYREGAQIALVGRPNVGKSSLMNALLRADRAIVTPIAGTTRDVIAETCNIRGIPATLLDTAGIAETADVVERLGIERSQRALSASAAAVLVLDGTVEPMADDLAVARLLAEKALTDLTPSPSPSQERGAMLKHARAEGEENSLSLTGEGWGEGEVQIPIVIAINKRDLPERAGQSAVLDVLPGMAIVEVSSKTGAGLDALEDALAGILTSDAGASIQPSLISTRQKAALERARFHLHEAKKTRQASYPLDLMATDVRAALHAIGEVTGENIDEAVLTEIFSRFCIGK
jgi:tRNA modification GTPase